MSIIGQAAPDFSMEAVEKGSFKQVSLKDYEGKWLILFFYPLDFTFVCPTEILAFSKAVDHFKNLNAELLGVSVDSKFTHLAWTEKPQAEGGIAGLEYPLASDLSKQVATRYNVLAAGGVALRGLFIVDPKGIIQHATLTAFFWCVFLFSRLFLKSVSSFFLANLPKKDRSPLKKPLTKRIGTPELSNRGTAKK